jgi:hypothetical protein
MTQLVNNRIAQWLFGPVALGALGGLTLTAPRVAAQTAYGQGYAAVLSLATGSQQLAGATLPPEGGMAHSDLDNVTLANTLSANTLNSITSGMADAAVLSAQTTAEAAAVTLLNGLITARQVLGVASSYLNQQAAASAADGSMLVDLVVNGIPLDGTPPPNTRIDLPGVGYVVLNEQTPSGNGVTASGITVNMIHLVLRDALTGLKTGEVVVGSATSSVAY